MRLICSSRAGRDAVEQVLDAREEQLQWRTGASAARLRSQRPPFAGDSSAASTRKSSALQT